MKKINWHYPREKLANEYLKIVYQGAINRIALLDVRRTGKTSFLLKDFFPEAIKNDFVPVYINLWLEPENPTLAIITALEQTLAVLAKESKNALLDIAKTQVTKIEFGNSFLGKVGVEFSDDKVIKATETQLSAINKNLARLVSQVGDKLILIIDEVQHLGTVKHFDSVQRSLRTALDTYHDINVVYSGSSRSGIDAMFKDKDKAFYNSAFIIDFPRLDIGFVRNGQSILNKHFNLNYDINELNQFYLDLDQSPFWFMQLLNYLLVNQVSLASGIRYINQAVVEDGKFIFIASSLNELDKSVLNNITTGGQQIYAKESLGTLSKQLNQNITASNIQGSIKKLTNKKIISKYNDKFYIELPGFIKFLKG